MTSKVEEVARGIQLARHDAIRKGGDMDAMCARAAIEAMREPSEEVRLALASNRFRCAVSNDEVWQAAIDGALTKRHGW